MINDPYKILDLPPDSDEELLKARYEELKAKYGEQRFASGKEGNDGALKLMELEEAWKTISQNLDRDRAKRTFGGDLGQIDDLIRKGKYDEAQALLDAYTDRGAEWHYLQSIVFYKRDWLTESRKQLKMAVELEPNNEKYASALTKLEMVMGRGETDARDLKPDNAPPTVLDDPSMQMGNCLSNCCMAYCLTDCCCSMMHLC